MQTASSFCFFAAQTDVLMQELAHTIQQLESQEAPSPALAAVQGLLDQLVAAGVQQLVTFHAMLPDATLTVTSRVECLYACRLPHLAASSLHKLPG
jgi:hypothetical protein